MLCVLGALLALLVGCGRSSTEATWEAAAKSGSQVTTEGGSDATRGDDSFEQDQVEPTALIDEPTETETAEESAAKQASEAETDESDASSEEGLRSPGTLEPQGTGADEIFYIAESCDARFFTGFPPDQAWCMDEWAMATVDGFGVDLAGYRLVGGVSRVVAQGPITGEIDITETLNLGLPAAVGELLCRQAAEIRGFVEEQCRLESTAGAAALSFVQAHLWDTPINGLGTADSIAQIGNLRTGLEYTPFLNRLASWEVAGGVDGCWLAGGVSVRCAVDLRSLEGEIVDTVVLTTYPRGVTDGTFEGFTGTYEVTGATVGLSAAGVSLDEWSLGANAFGPIQVGATLAEAKAQLGFDVDIAEPTTAGGSCVFATPIGFPGLFYVVELSPSSTAVLDGVVHAIVATAADYVSAWGPRVGSTVEAVEVTLGQQLSATPHARSSEGRYFDILDATDPDHIVRFESFDGETISQIRAGQVDAVRSAEGCG